MKWIYNFRVARLLGSGILIGPNWSLEWALLKRLEKESYELRHLREELACLSSSSVVRFHLQVRAVDLSQQTHEVVIGGGGLHSTQPSRIFQKKNYQCCRGLSTALVRGKWLEKVGRTHQVLAGGMPVLPKNY